MRVVAAGLEEVDSVSEKVTKQILSGRQAKPGPQARTDKYEASSRAGQPGGLALPGRQPRIPMLQPITTMASAASSAVSQARRGWRRRTGPPL